MGPIVISRPMARDERWQTLASYAFVSGVAIALLFLVTFAFAPTRDTPPYPWLGLLQRATLAVWFPCAMVIALRLLRIAKAGIE